MPLAVETSFYLLRDIIWEGEWQLLDHSHFLISFTEHPIGLTLNILVFRVMATSNIYSHCWKIDNWDFAQSLFACSSVSTICVFDELYMVQIQLSNETFQLVQDQQAQLSKLHLRWSRSGNTRRDCKYEQRKIFLPKIYSVHNDYKIKLILGLNWLHNT